MTVYNKKAFHLILSILFVTTASFAQTKTIRSKNKLPQRTGTLSRQPVRLSPQRLHFCGEIVPTEQGDVTSKLALALANNSGYVRHLNSLKARSAPFFSQIEPILARHNIPNDFKYLPLIESAWKANAVSSAGAIGYWQFMDDTAQDMGLSIASGKDERTDLIKSTEAACKYIKFLYRKLGSWTLVAAAYNGGVGMVQRKMSKTGHRDYYAMTMNAETGYYLYRILAMKELFTNPSYGLGSVGLMLASTGDEYEKEREQARRMGWLQDEDPELTGIPIESFDNPTVANRSEAILMDSLLANMLKKHSFKPILFPSDAVAKLVRAGLPKVGQSWTFVLTESIQVDDYELKPGDILYAVVDDIDNQNNLFLRATKAVSSETKTIIPLTLIAMNPTTGLAGVPRPKMIKTGWVVQWKL